MGIIYKDLVINQSSIMERHKGFKRCSLVIGHMGSRNERMADGLADGLKFHNLELGRKFPPTFFGLVRYFVLIFHYFYSRGSMYGIYIYTYIWLICKVNVGQCAIHGSFAYGYSKEAGLVLS